jgi:hypothetical protein
MKMRVTTSGVGETCIRAVNLYDDCAMKRKAMYSFLNRLGSQYLRVARPFVPKEPSSPEKSLKEFYQRVIWKREAKVDTRDNKEKGFRS